MGWSFYNSSGQLLTAPASTSSADLATEATNVTVSANNSTDETVYPVFVDGATGTQGVESDTGLSYNPSTGVLTTTSVTGNLTGNVTGNTSGSAGTATGNAGSATVLQTARDIGGVSFNGSANIDLPGVNAAGNQNTTGTAAGLSATLAVSSGGTGATSLTDKAVLISQDSSTDTVGTVALTISGQIVVGGSSGPAAATIGAGTNITVTNGDGSITIGQTSAGVGLGMVIALS